MKEKQIDKTQFKELYQHLGSHNYEVHRIFPKEFEISETYLDTIANNLNIYGKTNPIKKQDAIHHRRKVDFLGNVLDEGPIYTLLKDGTLWYYDEYNDWTINGDNTKHRYIDPISNEEIEDPFEYEWGEKNFKKWLVKFNDLYEKSDYVYIKMSFYYFKIGDKWYLLDDTLEESPADFRKQYPPKEDQNVRMVELQDLAPEFYHEGHPKRDTSLIKMVAYESAYFEKVDEGLNQYNFSAGWWYLEIPMPLGDTIRIKRYSNYEDPELLIYKVPGAYGGREDVLFIIQKPEELFPDQVGGMYAIRPRDPEQPQRRYKSISYGDTSKGQPHILRAEETEEYKQWKSTRKD